MADTRVVDMTAETAPMPSDVLHMVDTSGGIDKQLPLSTAHIPYTTQSVSTQGAGFASDTYVTGTYIAFREPPAVGSRYESYWNISKTAAGTATPIIQIRVGTAGTTSDTSRCTFTFGAGTGAADEVQLQITAYFRTVGSGTSAVLIGMCAVTTNLTTTGWSNAVKVRNTISSGFNSTTASLGIGCSYNGGASAAHTITFVQSKYTP